MNKQTLLNAIEKFIKAEQALEEMHQQIKEQFPDMSEWSFMSDKWEAVDAIIDPYTKTWQESRSKMFDINVKYCARNFSKYMARKVNLVQKEKVRESAQLLVDMYNRQ